MSISVIPSIHIQHLVFLIDKYSRKTDRQTVLFHHRPIIFTLIINIVTLLFLYWLNFRSLLVKSF